MYIWVNTQCINDETHECVCPYCRWNRIFHKTIKDGGIITLDMKEQYMLELCQWNHRNDEAIQKMKDRYPNDD